MIKVWLDDLRPAPDRTWIHVKNRDDLRLVLSTIIHTTRRPIDVMSFDHDLGPDEPDGYDIIKWLASFWERQYPLEVRVHSANPIGAENIRAFDRNWRKYGQEEVI